MTYQKLRDIAKFLGRLEAEKFAARYTAAERLHCQAVREAIDETVDSFYEELAAEKERDDDK